MALKREHFFLMFAVFVIDRISKFFISNYLQHSTEILPFLNFSFVKNTGIAFSLFEGFNLRWLFVLLSFAVVIFLFVQSKREKNSLVLYSFALIIAGALGNALDRILFGSVVDFIDFSFWPAFNVADSAITVGVLLLVYYSLKD